MTFDPFNAFDAFGGGVVPIPALLTGTLIGTNGSYQGNPSQTKAAAVDGSTSTFFDGPDTSPAWVGWDFVSQRTIKSCRVYPRSAFPARLVGSKIQISDDPTFASFTDLHTITVDPGVAWVNISLAANITAARCVRWWGPAMSYGNVAELEFYGY
jgi:hypothetical protein